MNHQSDSFSTSVNIMNLEHVSIHFGIRPILDDVTVGIGSRDKIGVIGINGQGKSTLLKIAAGELEADTGKVTRMNGLRVAYLAQNPVFDEGKSLEDNITSRIHGKEGHWDIAGEARAVLQKFGIDDPSCSPAVLSGGQKKRAALAAAMLTPSDLLILDEPTNHLDSEMIEYLQNWLAGYQGALLMVTHDRYFLDEVTTEILEIDHGKTYRYDAGYSGYLELKQQRLDYAKAAERKMAALYKQDLAWMMRGARARSTKQKAHIQRFEALRDRDPLEEERQVQIASLPSRIGGKTIELAGVSKSYGGKLLFRDFSYIFLKTDRIGIIGPNGCGKSTLLRMILGLVQPDSGSVTVGQTIRFGYFSQENEELDESLRVIDYIRNTAEYIRTAEGLVSASEMCDRFLFDPKMQYSLISKLSGGEKRRLYLLHVLMENPNVLILDEPTNDLDIQTLQILEDYLDHFAGIIITVSHDRYFLDRVVTRIFAFEPDGTLWQSEGGYEEYRAHRQLGETRAVNGAGTAAAKPVAKGSGLAGSGRKREDDPYSRNSQKDQDSEPLEASRVSSSGRHQKKLSYKDQREYDTIEGIIDELTQKSEDLDRQMQDAATDYTKLAELSRKKEETDTLLEQKMERFLELQDLVDSLQDG